MVLQIVILAGGRGGNLYPLTTHIPKMLLPIANKPLIVYVLEMLSRSEIKFQNPVHILTQRDYKNKLEKFLETRLLYLDSISYELHGVPEEYAGTTGALRFIMQILPKENNDLLIISGDLLLNFTILPKFLQHHRFNDCGCTIMTSRGKTHPDDMQIFALNQNQVVRIFDAMSNEDGFVLPIRTLFKYPRMHLRNDLIQNYCYLIKRELLAELMCNPQLDRTFKFKEEVIQFLVRKQMALETKVEVFIIPEGDYSHRVSDIKSYMEANLLCCRPLTGREKSGQPSKPLPSALLETGNNPKNSLIDYYRPGAGQIPPLFKQVSNDSIISEEFKIGDKCVITKSILGKNTKIGNKCKIVSSIIMDNVTIDDEVNINNSIICSQASVGSKCKVLNSQMALGSSLQANLTLKEEIRLNLT